MDDERIRSFAKLNPVIWRYRRKRIITAALNIVVIEILTAFVTWQAIEYYGMIALPWGILCAMVLPLLVKPWKYFSKCKVAVIYDYEYFLQREKRPGWTYSGKGYHMQVSAYIHLLCKDDEGKTYKLKVYQKYESVYRIGDRVMIAPGLRYPVDLTRARGEDTICPSCGSMLREHNDRCVGFGCNLPKVDTGIEMSEIDQ